MQWRKQRISKAKIHTLSSFKNYFATRWHVTNTITEEQIYQNQTSRHRYTKSTWDPVFKASNCCCCCCYCIRGILLHTIFTTIAVIASIKEECCYTLLLQLLLLLLEKVGAVGSAEIYMHILQKKWFQITNYCIPLITDKLLFRDSLQVDFVCMVCL